MTSLAVLSEHALFREGVAALLQRDGFKVSSHASLSELVAKSNSHPPDSVVVDLDHYEREDTAMLVRALHRDLPNAQIIAIGAALRHGAAGTTPPFVETPIADATMLARAATGSPTKQKLSTDLSRQLRRWARVTPRGRDVLRWLALGIENRAIGHELGIGERAVKAHVSALLRLFDVENRTQLALLADHAGLRPLRRRRG
jgi:DNA-binding NarL/FixJ family response regulator